MVYAGCGSPQPDDVIAQARRLVQNGNLAEAEKVAGSIPKGDKAWGESRFLLGEIEMDRGNAELALQHFLSVPRNHTNVSVLAAEQAGEIQFKNCQISGASQSYEYVVAHRPDDQRIRSMLASMLCLGGHRVRAETHLMSMLRQGRMEIKDLVMLTQPERQLPEVRYLQQCSQSDTIDPFIAFGLAAEACSRQELEKAHQLLIPAVHAKPDSAEAQALLGELTLDNDVAELSTWYAQLPTAIRDTPGIWFVRGLWARRLNRNDVAARCFWETIRKDPIHRRAFYQLGQVMSSVDKTASDVFLERSAQLQDYANLLESVLIDEGKDRSKYQRMVNLLIEMGRSWEAWAWVSMESQLTGNDNSSLELPASASSLKGSSRPRFDEAKDLASRYDLSKYPDFDATRLTDSESQRLTRTATGSSPVVFVDHASECGLDFTYFQSPDKQSKGVRIFESTGGGVGVFDYDLDGWPDLYLTQGEEWPLNQSQPVPSARYRDCLFRNLREAFGDATDAASLPVDDAYGQGCSCGDFDNDGFPDLYVANIGLNQLLLNNGDGTFSSVTIQAGISGAAWTTSCLILDLNADGNPDLFDVNYLQGENVFTVECGKNRCSVHNFEGAPDQVQLSRGDGSFETIPDATPKQNAKGLGVVALYLNDDIRPHLFVANDQVPNFFLHPAETDGRYADEAIPAGLALNRDGRPTACMGVAAADVDHNGGTDLFVTNFEAEANCLYLQRNGHFFEDAIAGTGLMSAGVPFVGWGTQFLDADNDGNSDLVVANGHVADFREPGIDYRMPLQMFRNSGECAFQLENPAEAGSMFQQKRFGRSIARLDWNRDGLEDFVVSCIESPVVLATNQTPQSGHWLNVVLHARHSSRDATGTIVAVHTNNAVLRQQLIAGDGYQASNERCLHWGLGSADTIRRLEIRWPSGTVSSFDSLPTDVTIHAVEGNPNLRIDRETLLR
jgi:thioredoxin-like negative regulator of GroEL